MAKIGAFINLDSNNQEAANRVQWLADALNLTPNDFAKAFGGGNFNKAAWPAEISPLWIVLLRVARRRQTACRNLPTAMRRPLCLLV
jgi:hypothetical protein